MQTLLSLWLSWDFSAPLLVPFKCILHTNHSYVFVCYLDLYAHSDILQEVPWLVCRVIFERGELKAIEWSAEAVSFLLYPSHFQSLQTNVFFFILYKLWLSLGFQAFPFLRFAVTMFLFYSLLPVLLKVLKQNWKQTMIKTSFTLFSQCSNAFWNNINTRYDLIRQMVQQCSPSRYSHQTCGRFWSAFSLTMRRLAAHFVHGTSGNTFIHVSRNQCMWSCGF